MNKENGFSFQTAFDLHGGENLDQNFNLYDLGYQNRSIDKFLQMLDRLNIDVLIDVRERPYSKKLGFSKSELINQLKQFDIDYLHIKELGSPYETRIELRKTWNYTKFFRSYRKYLRSHRDKLVLIRDLIVEKNVIMMCYESDYQKCHRLIIIEFLQGYGVNSIHL